MASVLTIIEFYDLAAGRSLLSLLRPATSRCSSREHPTHGPALRWSGPFYAVRTGAGRHPHPPVALIPHVTLNSFQGLSCSKPRARMDKWTLERQSPKVKQVQGEGGWRGRACYALVTRNNTIPPSHKKHFPTNNHMGYLIRVSQAAV